MNKRLQTKTFRPHSDSDSESEKEVRVHRFNIVGENHQETEILKRKRETKGSNTLILFVEKMLTAVEEEKKLLVKHLNEINLKNTFSLEETEIEVEIRQCFMEELSAKSSRLQILTKKKHFLNTL